MSRYEEMRRKDREKEELAEKHRKHIKNLLQGQMKPDDREVIAKLKERSRKWRKSTT